jgi:hypothetical protein
MPRGTNLLKYDPTNMVLFGQWNNNKVILFISTLHVFGMATMQRRVGQNMVDLQGLEALKWYTTDILVGV